MVVVPIALGSRPRHVGRALARGNTAARARAAGWSAIVLATAMLVSTVAVSVASDAALTRENSRLLDSRSAAVADLAVVRDAVSGLIADVENLRTGIAGTSADLESRTGMIE